MGTTRPGWIAPTHMTLAPCRHRHPGRVQVCGRGAQVAERSRKGIAATIGGEADSPAVAILIMRGTMPDWLLGLLIFGGVGGVVLWMCWGMVDDNTTGDGGPGIGGAGGGWG